MNYRENFFTMLDGGKPEFVPSFQEQGKLCVLPRFLEFPVQGGKDIYGINWIATPNGPLSDPKSHMFSEIEDWEKHVIFPDLNNFDFKKMAETEDPDSVRHEKVVYALPDYGMFLRLVSFMGFENTLISLIEDPDSCKNFFDAFSDYKIALINKVIDAYAPDVIYYSDDMATKDSLFMAPSVYREVIKPYHKKIIDAVTSRGVIFDQHICGKAVDIVDDFVDMGVRIWSAAQIQNDLESVQKKYGHKLLIEGGWDSSGIPGQVNATEQDIRAEVNRCVKTYGKYGNYILFPIMMNERGLAFATGGDSRVPAFFDELHKVNKL